MYYEVNQLVKDNRLLLSIQQNYYKRLRDELCSVENRSNATRNGTRVDRDSDGLDYFYPLRVGTRCINTDTRGRGNTPW